MAWKVTIDNGSTFTDGCLLTDTGVRSVKVLTTPYDLMSCFVEVFRSLARASNLDGERELLSRVEEVRYSTTAGTNALLVRKGVRVGLIIAPEAVSDIYGLRSRAPELVDTIVGSRVVGLEVSHGDPDELDRMLIAAVRDLLNRGAQWIAVSLPRASGAHVERRAKSSYMKLLPGHLLGAVPMLFSRELCADPDDAQRTATVLLNAFLHRDMAAFLYHADNWLRQNHVSQPLRIMRNDQGIGRVAKTTAVKTLDSGPMGGLLGAAALAKRLDARRMVTMDVGGTSTDIGVVEDCRPATDLFGRVHDLPLSFSFPTLRTAALGGGSVARVREGRILIGPESAGALPGPACFGRGGKDPTLTDAALLAGYLQAEGFAAGAIGLQKELAEQAVIEHIAKPLGLHDAAAGAAAILHSFSLRVGDEIASVLKRRGWTPDSATIVAYGGSGPLLACMVAEQAGVKEVVIPAHSASFSAVGVAFSDLAHEYRWISETASAGAAARDTLDAIRERAERDMFGEGASQDECAASIRVRCGDEPERQVDRIDQLATVLEGASGNVVFDYRLAARGSAQDGLPLAEGGRSEAGAATREILVGDKRRSVPVVDAEAVRVGSAGDGPCLLQSPYWSAVLPEKWRWSLTENGFRLSR